MEIKTKLKLPQIVDLRGYPELSAKKNISDDEWKGWLRDKGIKIEYKETSKYKKLPIPPSIRWEVWERDNFRCQLCYTRKNLVVDHIHPESKGGTLELNNLQTLCKNCNSKKGSRV